MTIGLAGENLLSAGLMGWQRGTNLTMFYSFYSSPPVRVKDHDAPILYFWSVSCTTYDFPKTERKRSDRCDSISHEQHLEVLHALDNFCFAARYVVAGYGYVIHPRWVHPHSADIGYRDRVDPHHSRTKSHLRNAL